MELLEFLKELDINNAVGVFVCGIAIIFVFVNYKELLDASNIEILLMNKTDMLKRNSIPAVILFCIFTALNYVYILSETFLVVNILMFIVSTLGYLGMDILNRFSKFKNSFPKAKGISWLASIMSFFPLLPYAIIITKDINKLSCILICALVETIVVFLAEFNLKRNDSKVILKIENKEWYVLQRLDDGLLCGNAKNATDSTEYMIIKLETIIEKALCFTKAQ